MLREVSLEEISDGRLYQLNDMVKADCGDCKDCFACCQGMGNSIILDPQDVYQLTRGLGKTFEELLEHQLELQLVDGMILPNIKMLEGEEKCPFLNQHHRCSIHSFRPGICRLFPLGRYYEKETFQYFLQIHECAKENRTKIKVKKWIDMPRAQQYDHYITEWHYFIKGLQEKVQDSADEKLLKSVTMFLLKEFYQNPYREEDFYLQFEERMKEAKAFMSALSLL